MICSNRERISGFRSLFDLCWWMAVGGSGEDAASKPVSQVVLPLVVCCNLQGFMSYSKPWNKSITLPLPQVLCAICIYYAGWLVHRQSLTPLWCLTISHDESSPCGNAGSETVFPIPRLDGNDAFCQICQKNANRSLLLEMWNERTNQVQRTSKIWEIS